MCIGGKAQWDAIYRSEMSCDEKVSRAANAVPIDPRIITAGELSVLPTSVPRFWYVVLANCDGNEGSGNGGPPGVGGRLPATLVLDAEIKLVFYNAGWDNNYPASFHLSADEIGFCELCIFLVSMYALGFVVIVCLISFYHKSNLLHEIHWLLIASFCCYFLAMILHLAHYSDVMNSGQGLEGCEIFARCFEVVGYLIFINTLLLVARGWTITIRKLSRKTENLFFTALLVVIYVALFLSETLRDPADSTYLYNSWAGYFFIAMTLFLMLTFHYLLHRTYVFEKLVLKRTFYRRFGFVYTLWFIHMPILVAISNAIPLYMQAKTLFGIERCVQLLAFFMLPMMVFSLRRKTKISQVAPAQGYIDPENATAGPPPRPCLQGDDARIKAQALANHDVFHNLPSGTDTEDQVPRSSAGIQGWAVADRDTQEQGWRPTRWSSAMAGAGVFAEAAGAGLGEESLTDEKLAMHFLRQEEAEEGKAAAGGRSNVGSRARAEERCRSRPAARHSRC
jgi:hypothetical protein